MSSGLDEDAYVLILDYHTPEVERLQAIESLGDLPDPGADIAAPVLGYEIEHGGPGFALELQRLQVGEPPPQPGRAGGVADGDGDVLPREGVDLVPLLTDQRDGLPVPGIVHIPQHELQRQVRYPKAHNPVQRPGRHRSKGTAFTTRSATYNHPPPIPCIPNDQQPPSRS